MKPSRTKSGNKAAKGHRCGKWRVPRTLAGAKGRAGGGPRGERAGRWGNKAHGDQAEFLHASQLYDRLAERNAGFWKKGSEDGAAQG